MLPIIDDMIGYILVPLCDRIDEVIIHIKLHMCKSITLFFVRIVEDNAGHDSTNAYLGTCMYVRGLQGQYMYGVPTQVIVHDEQGGHLYLMQGYMHQFKLRHPSPSLPPSTRI